MMTGVGSCGFKNQEPRTPVALANVRAPACTKELSTRLRNQEQEQQAPELSTWQSGARGRGAWSGKMRGFGNWGLGARAPVSSRAPQGATKSRSLHGATSLTCALVVRQCDLLDKHSLSALGCTEWGQFEKIAFLELFTNCSQRKSRSGDQMFHHNYCDHFQTSPKLLLHWFNSGTLGSSRTTC